MAPPLSNSGTSEVRFLGETLHEAVFPGTGEVRVTWLGLPVINDPFIVCEPGQPDPCPYVMGPMEIEFDLDLAGSPGGPYVMTYETFGGDNHPLMCVKLSFSL